MGTGVTKVGVALDRWGGTGWHCEVRCVLTPARDVPVISTFFGIVIRMFHDEHAPPHFHVEYRGQKAKFSLDGEPVIGQIRSRKARRRIREWAQLHQTELMANWARIEKGELLEPILPLE